MRMNYKMATLLQSKHFGFFFFQIVFELCLCLFDLLCVLCRFLGCMPKIG